jgi:hypothetical protein
LPSAQIEELYLCGDKNYQLLNSTGDELKIPIKITKIVLNTVTCHASEVLELQFLMALQENLIAIAIQ